MRSSQGFRAAVRLAVAAILPSASTGRAGIIVGYDTSMASSHNTYDRFLSPFPAAPVTNSTAQFLLSNFASGTGTGRNLSGIGWSASVPNLGVTLVSPQHIIGNYHVFQGGNFAPGSQVQFLNRDGVVKTYTLSSAQPFRPTTTFNIGMGNQTLPSDVYLGTLSAPIPAADHMDFFQC